MKKLLSMLGAVVLTGTASTTVMACENSFFNEVQNWIDTNGEVFSLVNVNGTIYAGTIIGEKKGKLFKINSDNIVSEVAGWTDTNGEIHSLVNVNGTIYAGTRIDRKGKLFKINSDNIVSEVAGWTDANGGVYSLVNVNGTIYAGTRTDVDKGNLYVNSKLY